MLNAYVGDLFEVDEQLVGLIEQPVLLSYLLQTLGLPDILVDIVLQPLDSVVLLLPAGNVELCKLKGFLDAFLVSEVLDGLHVRAFLLPCHDWKHLNVLDFLELEGSSFGGIENVEVLVPGKDLEVVLVLNLYDGRSVEDRWYLVLYVVLELLDLLLADMLKGCEVEVVLCLVPFDLILKVQLFLARYDPVLAVYLVADLQLAALEVHSV